MYNYSKKFDSESEKWYFNRIVMKIKCVDYAKEEKQ